MANTYTQLSIHLVFAVKGRESLLPREHRSELQKYITGIVKNHKHTLREEYIALLKAFGIPFDERYLFDFTATG